MLASDLGLAVDLPADDLSVASTALVSDAWAAEGESTAANDLVAFAKGLDAAGAKLYGSAWCVACTAQKQLFEDGGQFLPFIEVTNPDRTLNQIGIDAGIEVFPTWEFPDGSRETGSLSLDTISQRSGVAIPTSVAPSLVPIGDRGVLGGSPLHLALDGYDPNGGPLTYTVTSSEPSLVTPTVLSGNRSARVSVEAYGDMIFELFEGRVPEATGRFIELAEAGFYDAANNSQPITIHRVIDNFVFQFGDPTGTGAGGSTLDDFDDDFHPDLQHNNPGGISWAKAGDDTNDSQVFVIDVPTRFLDFNHSYFGQLTEGEAVRDAITATATNNSDQPIDPINIEAVEIFEDHENAIVMLKAIEGATGTADITVTVEDSDGNQFSETFEVTVTPDPYNGGPFLDDIADQDTTVNTSLEFELAAIDVEGDPVRFDGVRLGSVDYSFTVDSQTGVVSVTPPTDFVGTMELLVRVRPETTSNTSDTYDSQVVTITVKPDAPQLVDLASTTDTGSLDDDNVTAATDLVFEVSGVVDGAVVQLTYQDTLLGQTTATGTTAVIPVSGLANMGDGSYAIQAIQTVNGVQSDSTTPLEVTIDTTAPGEFTSNPPGVANVGQTLTYDAETTDEGTGEFQYSLTDAPGNATIDPSTGELTWTPESDEVGSQSFTIVASDLAGNTRSQLLTVEVGTEALIGFRLDVTDLQGNSIAAVDVGDDFLLSVFVEDLRPDPTGVFGAFLDVIYSDQFVGVAGPVTYGDSYPNFPAGDLSSPGLMDEVGAIASFSQLGGGEFLLFSVPMQATMAGQASFVGQPADDQQASELLLFDMDGNVDPADVIYGQTSLTVDIAFGANNDLFTVTEDDPGTDLDLLANDETEDGSPGVLTITDVTSSGQSGTTQQGGTVEIIAGGTLVHYVPAADFFGTDTFEYSVSDGTGSDTATVTVQVAAANDPPTAVDDEFTVTEDVSQAVLDVLANDLIEPDADETLTITDVETGSEGGAVTISEDGSQLLYTPLANFFGQETFHYTISDGNGGTDQAEVVVTVTAINDPPVTGADTITLPEDSVDHVIDVLANDHTAGDEDETLSIIGVTAPDQNGTAVISDDNLTIIYTPAPDFFGVERFVYTVSDGNGGTAEGAVTVAVQGTNDPPTANDDSFEVVKDTTDNLIDVLANDTWEPDAPEVLTIVSVGTPSAGGTVSVSSDGLRVEYSPAAGFTGTETVSYTIQDPDGATADATLTVEVLDYVPSDVSGFTYFDVNNNGSKDAGEIPIGGVSISLQGTDILGSTVQLTTKTNAQGAYAFHDLAPGSYRIIQNHPASLLDGIDTVGSHGGTAGNDQLAIELDQNIDATGYNFGERGRQARQITLLDFLASTPRDSIISSSGSDDASNWYAIEGGWNHASSLHVTDTDDPSKVEFQVTDDQAEQFVATLDLEDPRQVQPYRNTISQRLMRIVGSPQLLFPNADCACAPQQAEGESPTTHVAAAQASMDNLAEGEPFSVLAGSLPMDPLATDADRLALQPTIVTVQPETDVLGWLETSDVAVAAEPQLDSSNTTSPLSEPPPSTTVATETIFAAVGQQEDALAVDDAWVDRTTDRADYEHAVDELMADLEV